MKYFQDETDSIAETESDRAEVKGREEAEREEDERDGAERERGQVGKE